MSTWKAIKGTIIVAFLTAIDLYSKYYISTHFSRGESKPIIPGLFNLTLVHNSGAAFGVGGGWPTWFFLLVTVVMIGYLVYLYIGLDLSQRWSQRGVLLILSGALGNLVDRIRLGYVVDFLDVYYRNHHWPAFNVADSVILIGAAFFGIDYLLTLRRK